MRGFFLAPPPVGRSSRFGVARLARIAAMRTITTVLLLGACAALAACSRTLDERKVREFVDRADATARTLYAPHICELRGKDFTLHLKFQADDPRLPPSEVEIGRKAYCMEAAKNSRLRT